MLRTFSKKVNSAFQKLKIKQEAVGEHHSRAEAPEQEAERVQRELAAASAANDIATMIKIITRTSSLTASDYIQKTVGHTMFLYWSFVDLLHVYPRTLEDLVEGVLYLAAKKYVRKQVQQEQDK